jgi:hypothetical protein
MTNINVLSQIVVVIKGQKWSGQFLVVVCCTMGSTTCRGTGAEHCVNKLVEIGPPPLCTITYQKILLILVGLHAIFLCEAKNWCT